MLHFKWLLGTIYWQSYFCITQITSFVIIEKKVYCYLCMNVCFVRAQMDLFGALAHSKNKTFLCSKTLKMFSNSQINTNSYKSATQSNLCLHSNLFPRCKRIHYFAHFGDFRFISFWFHLFYTRHHFKMVNVKMVKFVNVEILKSCSFKVYFKFILSFLSQTCFTQYRKYWSVSGKQWNLIWKMIKILISSNNWKWMHECMSEWI